MKKRLFFLLVTALCLVYTGAGAAEEELTLSLKSGFYFKPIQVEITCTDADAQIHYTLDGSAPDGDDPLYTGPLSLSRTVGRYDPLTHITGLHLEEPYTPVKDFPSAHVLRAAAILPDGTVAATAAGTYFVGYRENMYGDLPIISLMMDQKDLFDYETGIFMLGATFDQWHARQTEPYEAWEVQGNFSNKGREWERPVTVNFMMENGEQFVQDMGARIKGAASRTAPQKSIRLIAREEYGKKNVKYPLFPGNICQADGTELAKYKSITLRNGANDRDNARFRDPYVSLLARGLQMETALSRPVVCFINGEYWGLYTLTEEYSDNYLANHYGLDNENVITIKKSQIEDGNKGDEARFRAMQHRIADYDMADPKAYAKAKELIDIKSLADYTAVTLYIANDDGIFHYNNWQMWRVRKPDPDQHPYADGKWRMMLYDSDYSSDVYGDGSAYRNNTIQTFLFHTSYEGWHPARIITSLMANEEFKKELILSLCDVRNLYFEKNRAMALMDRMTLEYTEQTNETFLRFGPDWVVRWNRDNHYAERLAAMRRFFSGRYNTFPGHIESAFQLEDYVDITVSSSDGSKGQVHINHRDIPVTDPLKVRYFPEYPITLTAQPEEGQTFIGWQIKGGGTLSDPSAAETLLSVTDTCVVTAMFE